MIYAVFDTNVLASCAVAAAGPVAQLMDAWQRGEIQVVVSSHFLRELDRALHNAYFATRLDAKRREAFLTAARATSTIVVITAPVPEIASTLADNLVLATAESAGAPYLVTGDRELLRLGTYKAVLIVAPRQFQAILDAESFRGR